jgi:hypothetical protein
MRTASARTLLLAALPLLPACPERDAPRRVEIGISAFEIGSAPFKVPVREVVRESRERGQGDLAPPAARDPA